MKNNYFYQMPNIDDYYNRLHSTNRNNNKVSMSEFQVPISNRDGMIEIFVFTERGQYIVPGAMITIYTKQENNTIPIYNMSTDSYPVTITLPVANPLGELIRGPEYYFTTYDLTVVAPGFSPYRCNNIRLFEGIKTNLDVNLVNIVSGQYPIPETIVSIPPHPRDIVNGQEKANYQQ